jgi:hypothetical protein
MANYFINIVQTKNYGKRTRPAKLTVEAGDVVTWTNCLTQTVLLTLNHGDLIFAQFPLVKMRVDSRPYTISIPGEGTAECRVANDALRGEHPYQVFCASSGEYAEGDSDPRIDIR